MYVAPDSEFGSSGAGDVRRSRLREFPGVQVWAGTISPPSVRLLDARAASDRTRCDLGYMKSYGTETVRQELSGATPVITPIGDVPLCSTGAKAQALESSRRGT